MSIAASRVGTSASDDAVVAAEEGDIINQVLTFEADVTRVAAARKLLNEMSVRGLKIHNTTHVAQAAEVLTGKLLKLADSSLSGLSLQQPNAAAIGQLVEIFKAVPTLAASSILLKTLELDLKKVVDQLTTSTSSARDLLGPVASIRPFLSLLQVIDSPSFTKCKQRLEELEVQMRSSASSEATEAAKTEHDKDDEPPTKRARTDDEAASTQIKATGIDLILITMCNKQQAAIIPPKIGTAQAAAEGKALVMIEKPAEPTGHMEEARGKIVEPPPRQARTDDEAFRSRCATNSRQQSSHQKCNARLLMRAWPRR